MVLPAPKPALTISTTDPRQWLRRIYATTVRRAYGGLHMHPEITVRTPREQLLLDLAGNAARGGHGLAARHGEVLALGRRLRAMAFDAAKEART